MPDLGPQVSPPRLLSKGQPSGPRLATPNRGPFQRLPQSYPFFLAPLHGGAFSFGQAEARTASLPGDFRAGRPPPCGVRAGRSPWRVVAKGTL